MISLSAETLFHLGPLPVTNSLLATWVVVLLLVMVALLVRRRVTMVPRGFINVVEVAIEWLLNLCDSVTNDRALSKKFFPLVATFFLFILTSNYLGLLPIFGPIGLREVHEGKEVLVPLFRSGAADLNFTLALALISVFATQLFGIAVLGLGVHLKKYINFRQPIMGFVGLLEAFSEIAKLISFSFRLFGNVFAGEVLLVVIGSLLAYIAPLPFYFLEMFVGLIQAFVFALLSLVFFRVATAEAH